MDVLPTHWPTALVVADPTTVVVVDPRAARTVRLDSGAVTETADATDRLRGGAGGAWEIGAAEVRWVPTGGQPVARWSGVAQEAASDGGVVWVRAEGALLRIAGNAQSIPAPGARLLAAGAGVAWVDADSVKVAGPDGAVTCTVPVPKGDEVKALALDAKWLAVGGQGATLLVDRAACKVAAAVDAGSNALAFGGGALVSTQGAKIRKYTLPNLAGDPWRVFGEEGLPDARTGRVRPAPLGVVTATDVRAVEDGLVAFDPGQLRVVGFDGAERVKAAVPLQVLLSADAQGTAWVATDGTTVVGPKGTWALPGTTRVLLTDARHAVALRDDRWVMLDLEDPTKTGFADDRAVQVKGATGKVAYSPVDTASERFRLRKDGAGVRVVGRWDQKDRGATLAFPATSGAVTPEGTFAALRSATKVAAFEVATGKKLWEAEVTNPKAAVDVYRGVVHVGPQAFAAADGKPTTAASAPMPKLAPAPPGELAFDPKVVAATFAGDKPNRAWCDHRDEVRVLLETDATRKEAVEADLQKMCGKGPPPKAPTLALRAPPAPTGPCAGPLVAPTGKAKPPAVPVQAGTPTVLVRADTNPMPGWMNRLVDVVLLRESGAVTASAVPVPSVTLACAKAVPRGQALVVDGAGKARAQGKPADMEAIALALALGLGERQSPAPLVVARGLPEQGDREVLADGGLLVVTKGALVRYDLEKGERWRADARKGAIAVVGDVVVGADNTLVWARSLADGAIRWAVPGHLVGVQGAQVAVEDDGAMRVFDVADPARVRWRGPSGVMGPDGVLRSGGFGWECARVFATGAVQACGKAAARPPAAAPALPEGFVLAKGTLTVTKAGKVVRTLDEVVDAVAIDAHRVVVGLGGSQGPRLVLNDGGGVVDVLPAGVVLGAKAGVVWMAHGDDAVAAYRP